MAGLNLDVASFATFAEGSLALLGRALDVDGRFRAERVGKGDPPRTRVASCKEALRGLEARLSDREAPYPGLLRDAEPGYLGSLHLGTLRGAGVDERPLSAEELSRGEGAVVLDHEFTLYLDEAPFRDDPDLLDGLAALFMRVCEAMDGYVGGVSFESAFGRQVVDFVTEAVLEGRRGRVSATPGRPDECDLGLPRWLSLFGPAYVDFFGRDRIGQLGVRVEWTANGGAVVWATPTPFVFDPSARATVDYPFVARWIEVLGSDTVVHETQTSGQPGEYVPRLVEHYRRARRAGDDPAATVGAWAHDPGETGELGPVPPASAWTLQTVTALRRIGFFATWPGSDAEVAAELDDRRRATTGAPFDPTDVWSELELAAEDTARVWWCDTESEVTPGAQAYVTAIGQWAAISQGALVPEQVEEAWDQPAGQVRIGVRLDGVTHQLVAHVIDDYLDVSLIDQLNELLADRGVAFQQLTTGDQTAYLLAVSPEQHHALNERRWPFAR